MEAWIPITIAAAVFQTVRFMLQKQLSTVKLSAAGATFARFVYSAPLVVLLTALYLLGQGAAVPDLGGTFWAYGVVGGTAQVLATVCVVALFRHRNFAVGITFKKTEVVQTVFVGLIVLGEGVTAWGFVAILVGLIGVLMLSDPPGGGRIFNRAAGLGLLSGLLFAISGVCYRGASLEIASDDALLRAAVTLSAVTSMQLLGMALWLGRFETGEVGRVLSVWRQAIWIGLTSMAGSLCWFTAFTLQTAAYVNALGQIELIFSLLATWLFFKEAISRRELAGMGLLCASILVLILLA